MAQPSEMEESKRLNRVIHLSLYQCQKVSILRLAKQAVLVHAQEDNGFETPFILVNGVSWLFIGLRHGVYEYKLRVDEISKRHTTQQRPLFLHKYRVPRWHLIHPAVVAQVGLKIPGEIHHIYLLVAVP